MNLCTFMYVNRTLSPLPSGVMLYMLHDLFPYEPQAILCLQCPLVAWK